MTYDELKNGLKSLFSTLGAKTSDSNYGVALLDKTSGEPKGLMGMSALASVLGGVDYIPLGSGSLNDCNIPGQKYYVPNGASVSDVPATGSTWFVFVIGVRNTCMYQIAYSALGNMIYERSNNTSNPTNWNNWYRCDNFGCNTPSDLASLLGVLTNKTQPIQANSSFTIDKGDKTAVLYCWANTATSSAPAIIMCARKSLTVHVDSDSLLVNQDVSNSVCVNIDSSTGNIIVKNNHSSAKNFSYLLLRVEI